MENVDILLSVVCTTYNHEKYLKECIEGFLIQETNFKWEILIHDDASTDGTADIIKVYASQYPDLVRPIYQSDNQYSKGVRVWSEIVFPLARGKYIALCEGDDYWTDPLKLQKQVDFLENNPACSAVFHNSYIVDSQSDYVLDQENNKKVHFPIADRVYSQEEIANQWVIPTNSFVFRKDCFVQLRRDSRVMFGDILLFLNIGSKGALYGMSDVLSCYRRHQGGASYLHNIDQLKRMPLQSYYMQGLFQIDLSKRLSNEYWVLSANYLKKFNLAMFFSCQSQSLKANFKFSLIKSFSKVLRKFGIRVDAQ